MSEIALWLNYGLSGLVAFLIIYVRGWRIVPAMLAATIVGLAVYMAASTAGGGSLGDPRLGEALVINGSCALVAAFFGAALAWAVSRGTDS